MRLAQQERFTYLFNRFYNKTYSPQERQEFLHLVASGHYHDLLSKLTDAQFELEEASKSYFSPEMENLALDNILSAIRPQASAVTRKITIKTPLLRVLQVAAVLVILSAGIFYFKGANREANKLIVYDNDVPAGHSGAILTLAGGKNIQLSKIQNGEVVRLPGLIIHKSSQGKLSYKVLNNVSTSSQVNILSTQNGETFELELPDGSKVWLNAASSLTYSTGLHLQKKRIVKLEGEAYFEVSKDTAHPFLVESQGQQIEVLGTHFNMSAYPEDPMAKTTLLEGSIRVTYGAQQTVIQPGFEAVNSNGGIKVQPADTELAVGWKNGQFVFENQDITQIMKSVARWYNVEVIYNGDLPDDVFGGSVSRNDSISHVLSILESTGRVHFKVEGRKVFVSK